MKIHSDLSSFNAIRPVVTLGMFDGVHIGHRKLLGQLVSKAKEIDGESVVITFWPHPRMVLKQGVDELRFLTSPEERTVLFSQLGIDHLVLLPFTKDLAALTAEEFISDILVDKLKIAHLLIGFNHRFGRDKIHQFDQYQAFARQYNFQVSQFEAVLSEGLQTSSSHVRNHLLAGDVVNANKILGYRYTISGQVIGGKRLGRSIGFPTANVEVEERYKLIPPDGVYACFVRVEGHIFQGMLNIGYRPTVNQHIDHRTLEVHIFDFNRDIYSEVIQLEFVTRVRDEAKFDTIDALKSQLINDEKAIRMILSEQ